MSQHCLITSIYLQTSHYFCLIDSSIPLFVSLPVLDPSSKYSPQLTPYDLFQHLNQRSSPNESFYNSRDFGSSIEAAVTATIPRRTKFIVIRSAIVWSSVRRCITCTTSIPIWIIVWRVSGPIKRIGERGLRRVWPVRSRAWRVGVNNVDNVRRSYDLAH